MKLFHQQAYVKFGDFVNYDAGIWEKPESEYNNIKHNGISSSKNASYLGEIAGGWRCCRIEEDVVYLIHAGCPASSYFKYSGGNISLNDFCIENFLNHKYANNCYLSSYSDIRILPWDDIRLIRL